MSAQISILDEIIVDNFAGGGGASTGIELATGRPVTIAINHDPNAILMHKTNHPFTEHYQASVWDVDPEEVCRDRLVGLAWFSPDCKHFSKAKGGKPVDKNIRGLAWIVLRWAGTVRPRVIILENVEEFQTWGPVRRGHPVKSKSGQTFRRWVSQLKDLGYAVDWRELVAADYGAPTTRKRFFLVARCDGAPIVWPEPTHAPADSIEVQKGVKKPWRSAAKIINWSLPCPSIFDTREQIRERYGLSAQRPLRPNTMRRVIRGVDKFAIKNPSPFLVVVNHTGDFRGQEADAPLKTVTAKHGYGVASPVMVPLTVTNTTNSVGAGAGDPIHTVTTAGNQMMIAPTLTAIGQTGGGERGRKITEPTHTQVSKAEECVIAPALIQYHTEQPEHVRGQEITGPIMTIDSANRYGFTAASLVKYYGNDQTGQNVRSPLHTITAKDREGVTLAHMAKFYGTEFGEPVTRPLSTVTASGAHHGVVTMRISKAEPGVGLGHWPEIRDLLNEYCGYGLGPDDVILFEIDGTSYFMEDIGLRMLTPRELYRANGFPDDYRIERDYTGTVYPKTKQVARCGNAVPPPFATALVRSNLPEWCDSEIRTMEELKKAVAV
ncbi:DNA cytosine methyltransferase [Candidatus Avoscillospira sp. LCP25S3_F1]|uniref:DNA cytosine methyltransferase n=1 Tax=Candidatus Avoscillospira sp. LCP25S3_F1 TaxID=3438825 RepID=UPI003F90CFCA